MNKNKKITSYFIIIAFVLVAGIVYALLQATLDIDGSSLIKSGTWDIHFANIQVTPGSVSIGTGDSAATIDPSNNCKVDFEVTLPLPGDFYEFTVDVVNAGTLDGMLNTFVKTLKVNGTTVSTLPEYLTYSVTYSDGVELQQYQLLGAGETETYKVRIELDSSLEELPPTSTITANIAPVYIQADNNGIPVRVSEANFATDSWDAITAAYNAGKRTNLQAAMEAGTTREVQLDMNNDGTAETTAHLRIANLSTPAECSTTGFSQSACGFVIEFADVITTYVMNSPATNVGGWPASSLYSYVNTDIFNALPSDLKSKIIETNVISGHGSTSGETNFTSTDRLYLFSTKEIWGKAGTSNVIIKDSAEIETRQLDYYFYKNVTTSSYSGAIKKNLSETATYWWLRSACSSSSFFCVNNSGDWSMNTVSTTYGVSPAFRIR